MMKRWIYPNLWRFNGENDDKSLHFGLPWFWTNPYSLTEKTLESGQWWGVGFEKTVPF
jgi:hypothetical protein